jgi:hypothetical protein
MIKKMLFLVVTLFLFSVTAVAQVTTSSMSGKVASAGEPIIGASVIAVHQPSGTKYGAVTNIDGRYSIQGMRTGGPYRVEVSYVGYNKVITEGVYLQLGQEYNLNAAMTESSTVLKDVLVTATRTKFNEVKTGASTNINNEQMTLLPTISRSLNDFTRLSPYAGGDNSFAGRDGRTNTLTIDGANLNNNFGLSSTLPGGGNPISLDAIEEIQVVVAPFDVRQTNFVGGGINAITKSGTNTFRGSVYSYWKNQHLRGNKVDGYDLGSRSKESKTVYGFTLGGPIIKNKLFFFVNYETEKSPNPITKWQVSSDGKSNADQMISRVSKADMDEFSSILKNDYGYDAGSYSNYDANDKNHKFLARIDWNINDYNKLSVRYNNTKNTSNIATNGTSTVGTRAASYRISSNAMAFRNACYSMDNNVWSITAELNSQLNSNLQNRALLTYSKIEDKRSSPSSPFPFIDIWDGAGDAYMSAGYELFTWNNAVNNKTLNFQDNVTWNKDNHRIIGGLSFEHQLANNSFMRFGTGYYKFKSFSDFKSGAAPIAFGLTYGYNGELNPTAEVAFNQYGLYLQDEWNIKENFKLTYGIRADLMHFTTEVPTNEAYKAIDWKDHFVAQTNANYASYKAPSIDTGKWPSDRVLLSPRIGFNWDVRGDKTLIVRGGTGVFTGRIPLVFFTNMPTNGMMLQNTIQYTKAADLAPLAAANNGGKYITDVNKMISALNLPTSSPYTSSSYAVKGASICGIDSKFKLPQVWKNALAVDYNIPVGFPLTMTVEAIINKDIHAVTMENYNVTNAGNVTRFSGPDNRLNYKAATNGGAVNTGVTGGAIVLKNTSKGYGSTFNIMFNAEPINDLKVMASYTHTVSQQITGLPGSQAYSAWQNIYNVDGPNETGLSRSQYVTPNKVIASVSYRLKETKNLSTNFGLFYAGYNSSTYNYVHSSDFNGDGSSSNDLLYIPKSKDELVFQDFTKTTNKVKTTFTAAEQQTAFWDFINQDKYLKNHKGQYAKAYDATLPWLHRFDLKVSQDLKIKVGKYLNTLQFSVDILNFGNMLNDKWGVTKTLAPCNNGQILYYAKSVNGVPVFQFNTDPTVSDKPALITKTYSTYKNSSNCWQLQFGIRYIFN